MHLQGRQRRQQRQRIAPEQDHAAVASAASQRVRSAVTALPGGPSPVPEAIQAFGAQREAPVGKAYPARLVDQQRQPRHRRGPHAGRRLGAPGELPHGPHGVVLGGHVEADGVVPRGRRGRSAHRCARSITAARRPARSPAARSGPGRKSGTSCGALPESIETAARIAGAAVSAAAQASSSTGTPCRHRVRELREHVVVAPAVAAGRRFRRRVARGGRPRHGDRLVDLPVLDPQLGGAVRGAVPLQHAGSALHVVPVRALAAAAVARHGGAGVADRHAQHDVAGGVHERHLDVRAPHLRVAVALRARGHAHHARDPVVDHVQQRRQLVRQVDDGRHGVAPGRRRAGGGCALGVVEAAGGVLEEGVAALAAEVLALHEQRLADDAGIDDAAPGADVAGEAHLLHQQEDLAGPLRGGHHAPAVLDRRAQRHLDHGVAPRLHGRAGDRDLHVDVGGDRHRVRLRLAQHALVVREAGHAAPVLPLDRVHHAGDEVRAPVADRGQLVLGVRQRLADHVAAPARDRPPARSRPAGSAAPPAAGPRATGGCAGRSGWRAARRLLPSLQLLFHYRSPAAVPRL